MPTSNSRPLRRLSVMAGALVATAALLPATPAATAQSAPAPAPHWGNYQWYGGQEKVNTRAFWLVDRTGDRTTQALIRFAADAWNRARETYPVLPYIAIAKDDANAGRCFVNRTPGYSVASACMIPENIHGVTSIAARRADTSGHLLGAAFAITDGLAWQEALSAVCHGLGHVMGLDDSENPSSCMFPTLTPGGPIEWYDDDDLDAILDLYGHDEDAPASTTTTSAPTTSTTVAPTTTTVAPTTTTVAPTTTTVAPTTTTTTPLLCDAVPLPVGCPGATTTTVAGDS